MHTEVQGMLDPDDDGNHPMDIQGQGQGQKYLVSGYEEDYQIDDV